MIQPKLFHEEILPQEWSRELRGPFYIFNPGIARLPQGGFAMAFRVVASDGRRRIGACRLDAGLAPIPGSSIPLSDALRPDKGRLPPPQAGDWFADPRLSWWQGRLYLYWNTGSHRPMNYQFLQELDILTLQPVGLPYSLECADGRNPIEKNWSLFECEGDLYAFYSLMPAVVLRLIERTSSAFVFSKMATLPGKAPRYSSRFGIPRGGAPPLLYKDKLYILFHSIWLPWLRPRYSAGLLITAAKPPFEPLSWSTKPIPIPNPFGSRHRFPPLYAAVASAVYPTGAIVDGQTLLVSYGINDEQAALARLDLGKLENKTLPACIGDPVAHRIYAFLLGLPGKVVRRVILQKDSWAPAPTLGKKHGRAKPALRCFYWGEEYPLANLGDLLGQSIVEALGYACVPRATDDSKVANPGRCLLAIGSLLNGPHLAQIAYSLDVWGCGWKGIAKSPAGCKAIRFFAVRGPNTAEGLRLPSDIALGDPALLLPKLFEWSVVAHGRTVVIPHCSRLADMHASQRCLRTGCDEVVSPFVVRSPWHQALQPASLRAAAGLIRRRARMGLRIHNLWSAVRRIAGAKFVLTGSLHGSILAQAFGVPWAMYDDGYIDAPAKWADWAAYLNIEIEPVRTLKDGRQWWDQVGCHARIRNLGPLLRAFPYEILNPKARHLAQELP